MLTLLYVELWVEVKNSSDLEKTLNVDCSLSITIDLKYSHFDFMLWMLNYGVASDMVRKIYSCIDPNITLNKFMLTFENLQWAGNGYI